MERSTAIDMKQLLSTIVLAAALLGGPRSVATGFFHFENVDGADWAIDPEGHALTLTGVDFVNPDVFYSTFLGYAPYKQFVATNYPSREAWAEETAGRLRAWGFTMLASHCAVELFPGFPHADTLNLNNPFAKSKDPEWRIAENKDAPSTGFPNVFHPDYEKAVFAAAAKRCAPSKDDPTLVGWFIDNELAWWGRGSDPGTGLFDLVAQLPSEHSARKALDQWLDGNRRQSAASEVTRETKIAFLRLIAERYFSINAAAIRAADPNHAVLGCRFAGGTLKTHDVVWEAAGKYCDAVSFNCYAWCDLDRGIVLTDQGGLPVLEEFRRVHALCGRPMLVTEWSFPALDTGRPCLHGAGQRFHTQQERAAAVELFARTILAEPYMVGYNWFMWVDQPAVGLRPAFPEDSNYGLVGEDGRPYELVTEAFARVNKDAASLKAGGPRSVAAAVKEGGPRSVAAVAARTEPGPPLVAAVAARTEPGPPLVAAVAARTEPGPPPVAASARTEPGPPMSTRERFFADAFEANSLVTRHSSLVTPSSVGFVREADGFWSLSNGLVRLAGRIGGAFMADEIAFSKGGASPPGEPSADGRFRTLLQRLDGSRRLWTDTDRVTDIAFSLDEATGIGTVTIRAEGGMAGTSREVADAARRDGSPHLSTEGAPLFAMTARLSLAPGCAEVLAEIVSAENLGDAPLRVERVFMRPYAAAVKPKGVPTVPKLWKGPHEGWWHLSDGRRFGAVSSDASSCSFRFYIDKSGVQHPDAPFVEDAPFEIAPGDTWRPSSPMGARLQEAIDGNR